MHLLQANHPIAQGFTMIYTLITSDLRDSFNVLIMLQPCHTNFARSEIHMSYFMELNAQFLCAFETNAHNVSLIRFH